MSSLLAVALKSNRIFIWYHTHVPIPRRSYSLRHQFYFLLEHERSEERYDTSDLLMLGMTSYHKQT
jgi:hypothetical protein